MSENVTNELIYKTLVSIREEVKGLRGVIDRNNDRIAAFQGHLGAQQHDIGLLYKRDEETHSWKQHIEEELARIKAKIGLDHPEH